MDLTPSGLYGHAWSIPPGTTSSSFSRSGAKGRYFNVETPDRRSLVTTVVIYSNGYYRVDLPPGSYFIDTGSHDNIPGIVQVLPRHFSRMDVVLTR